VIGSLVAVTGGWLTGLLLYAGLSLALGPAYQTWRSWSFELFALAAVMGAFAMTTWLFAFLPLYLVIPRESALWRPSRSVPLGAFAGAAVIVAFGWFESGLRAPYGLLLVLGAVVGGVSALLASATAHRFSGDGAVRATR